MDKQKQINLRLTEAQQSAARLAHSLEKKHMPVGQRSFNAWMKLVFQGRCEKLGIEWPEDDVRVGGWQGSANSLRNLTSYKG
jgi:hypothetical protein